MKEISEKAKKEKERLLEKKSLELTEDNLNEQEERQGRS